LTLDVLNAADAITCMKFDQQGMLVTGGADMALAVSSMHSGQKLGHMKGNCTLNPSFHRGH